MNYLVNIFKVIRQKRLLYTQILFTALAFIIMVTLSYMFAGNIVNNSLNRYAESVFTYAQARVESIMGESKLTLMSFSQSIRNMLRGGYAADDIQEYIDDMFDYLCTGKNGMPGMSTMFAYLEAPSAGPAFLSSKNFNDIGYIPEERPWYHDAIAAAGAIVETAPYMSMLTDAMVVTFARAIYNDDGLRMGVICLNLHIDDIGRDIVDISLDRGGYGMLFSQDMTIFAHANPIYVGMDMRDTAVPVSVFAGDVMAGNDITGQTFENWTGELTVAYLRKLPNGWYLGLLTPSRPFYQGVTNMMFILCALGVTLAASLIVILVRIDVEKNKSDAESRQKSAFLANMSHEMRTPMNAIIGMTSIGMKAADAERMKYCFTRIDNASKHLLGVINDVLDMSKIEANKLELSPVSFDFEKMLQKVVNVINFRVDEKRQNFYVKIDKNIPRTLIGDDHRLAQIITNLLSNAVKFTPEEGTITLESRLLTVENGIYRIQISVADTGIGVTEEQKERLFMSFEQAEAGTSRKFGGTCLGVAICKRIVDMMGGEIEVDSKPGQGTVFRFTTLARRGAEAQKPALHKNVDINNLCIFVVDDDPEINSFFTDMSESLNIKYIYAASGEEAVEMLSRGCCCEIIFIDWKLPGMSGVELVRHIRTGTRNDPILIIFSSADWYEIEDEARGAGVDKFLSKPLFQSDIVNLINECIGVECIKEQSGHFDYTDDFSSRALLLVEDVDINREIVMVLLEPTGVAIECAVNGLQAVEMFSAAQDRYDIIFMDVQMPEMDGYEATRAIRALNTPRALSIPIIAMTANVYREDIERCIGAGMDSHIGKPLDLCELLEKMRDYIK